MELRSDGEGNESDGNKADGESDTIWDKIDEDLKNEQILYVIHFCSFGPANDVNWMPVPLTILPMTVTVKKSLARAMFSLMLKMMALQS